MKWEHITIGALLGALGMTALYFATRKKRLLKGSAEFIADRALRRSDLTDSTIEDFIGESKNESV